MNKFMQIAIEEAKKGMENNEGGPFGAVIVYEGEVLSRAHNEVLGTNNPLAHAEMLAIERASAILDRFDLSDCVIYSTSRPCPMCMSAIFWARIPRVYYGTTDYEVAGIGFDDGLLYDLFSNGFTGSGLESVSLDHDECFELLKIWDQREDRQMY